MRMRGRRSAGAQGCDFDQIVMGSISTRGNELLFFNIFTSSLWRQGKIPALSFEKLGREWGMECFNTWFHLPFLLYAGHNVKRQNVMYISSCQSRLSVSTQLFRRQVPSLKCVNNGT